MTATALTDRRELAHRASDGLEITLFWAKATDRVTMAVLDTHSDQALEFDVEGHAALDAFNHPTPTPPHSAFAPSPSLASRSPADPANESTPPIETPRP